MMWGWGFGGFFMMFMMVIFWALIIVGIVFAVRAFSGAGTTMVGVGGVGKTRAIEILKERYARGEINTEEYESKKRELES